MLFNRRRCQALGQEEAGNQRQATGRTFCLSCRRPAPALRPRSGSSSSSSSDSLMRKDSHQVLDMLLSRQLSSKNSWTRNTVLSQKICSASCASSMPRSFQHSSCPSESPKELAKKHGVVLAKFFSTSAWLGNC